MKKVKNRAGFVLLLVLLCIFGLAIYCFRYVSDGREWVAFSANAGLYSGSGHTAGKVYDRNGVLLADAATKSYSDDYTTRVANFHLLGDYAGNTGTGVLNRMADRLTGFNPINGTYHLKAPELELTVDAALNNAAYAALAGRNGSVQIYNYKTGEVLCMVSSPGIDPANPGAIPDGAYINRAINATYVPGSVYKLVTLAAALENIEDIHERTFTCNGSVIVEGVRLNCTGVHGNQTIEQALAHSCNCAFSELAQLLGPDVLAEYSEKLGMTTSHTLDGIPTAAGSYEKFDLGTVNLSWSAIGQATDLVCPYSMLRLAGAIANGGTLVEPTLVGYGMKKDTTQLLSSETAAEMASMMSYNVQYSYGSGTFPGLNICAKTGTAEVGDGTDHAWFVGFLADETHPYAFVVQVERGGGGLSVAGAIANRVLQQAVSAN